MANREKYAMYLVAIMKVNSVQSQLRLNDPKSESFMDY